MKGDVLLQNIEVIGLIPASSGKKAKETKLLICESVLTKLGKNFDNVKKRCSEKPLSITILFFLHKATYSKKDLYPLSNAVIKILGAKTSYKKDSLNGLEIIPNTNLIHRIILEKTIVEKDTKEKFSFSIYEWD